MLLRILLFVAVLGGALVFGFHLLRTPPKVEKKGMPPMIPVVEVIEAQPSPYRIRVFSQGTVAPRTRMTLSAQVSGVIVDIHPSLRNGGFFDKGRILARIDATDHEHAITIAAAEVAKARLSLRETEAQAEQAKRDWEKSGLTGSPGALVLQQPQLEQARALLAAAQARLDQAKVDRDRTRIEAPFSGRVLEKMVDVGQFVARGTSVATLYAVDSVEVRLPISERQFGMLRLPESYPGEATPVGPVVRIEGDSGGVMGRWLGRIVRTEGTIDTRTRQVFVIAQVDAPYARSADGQGPLKVGRHVVAAIQGPILKGVFVLPREVVDAGRVWLVSEKGELESRPVTTIWQDREEVVVTAGLRRGEVICRTMLPYAVAGMKVHVSK
ncbi:MAG: efflux RND transporter periplasmic adaptor subunit [Magnetococcales bacterium]|nr:efflux RND transporter periplasmic adaptor subunit [Magnetococcales bacterium]